MPTARDSAGELLLRLERSGGRVRELLGPLRAAQADPRERGLLTELAYGCVRRQGTLDAVLARFSRRPLPRLNAGVRTALRLGLYQVLFLDRVPGHAAVDETVGWVRRHVGAPRASYVNAVLRAALRDLVGPAAGAEDERRDVPREDGSCLRFSRPVFAHPRQALAANLAQRYSMPTWLVTRWLERWGNVRCRAVLRAGITRPPVTLRARVDRAGLVAELAARGVACEAGPGDEALRLGAGDAGVEALVASGAAAVQDATSQRVAPLLEARAGMRVLDLCAAPGGKALHLADRMGSGEVVACDVDPQRVALLEELAPLARGVTFTVVAVPAEGPLPFAPGSFDAVLVDAPCSNTGVLRRRVEARWRLRPDDIPTLADLQVALVERALPLVRPGGRLVYSTCSLEREENEDVIRRVGEGHPGWQGAEAFRAWPGREQDGGYAAVLSARA